MGIITGQISGILAILTQIILAGIMVLLPKLTRELDSSHITKTRRHVTTSGVIGETVFDAHKSPSLDSKDRIEHDAKQLHSSLLLNTYNREAPSEISSDPHFSILPKPDLSQEELESNQIGDLNLDKQELSLDLGSSLVESDKLEGNTPIEEASQRYNIHYPALPRVILSPFAAEFIPLMPNPYAALFDHVEGLGNNSSLKDVEFDKIDDGNKVLCNNALEEIRDERDGPILYTHSEGEEKAFNENILKPLQIDYSRMFKTPFDLGRDCKGRRIYSPSQIVTRSRAKLLKEGRKKTPIGWEEGPDSSEVPYADDIRNLFKLCCPNKPEKPLQKQSSNKPLTKRQKKKSKKRLKKKKGSGLEMVESD
ncbi:hypothetical protein DM860_017483 [Cuscuta australis]|uniref:Uncharacterized protein n=1 Tax=Cuscuta australis TaxID=267555 RepID=A0A328DWA6_9ASTE|nr:hypothetical protein DM860_017483 [Cuscuta australis]